MRHNHFNSFFPNIDNFGQLINEVFTAIDQAGGQMFRSPGINISETDNSFVLSLAAPGLEKSDFAIQLENDSLSISVNKTSEVEQKFLRKEFDYKNFKRTYTLPESVDRNSIRANYENGILTIVLKKKEVATAVSKTVVIE
ncbi:MAG TPA: Hsp20/alpha crystallin family protein [Saprospiraceae bacterium]|nr:Hsp20/alpha crystallin family protein [Saprospiraceae bacterium]